MKVYILNVQESDDDPILDSVYTSMKSAKYRAQTIINAHWSRAGRDPIELDWHDYQSDEAIWSTADWGDQITFTVDERELED